jgi:hypothetical protein
MSIGCDESVPAGRGSAKVRRRRSRQIDHFGNQEARKAEPIQTLKKSTQLPGFLASE